jgi:hypothetical protein
MAYEKFTIFIVMYYNQCNFPYDNIDFDLYYFFILYLIFLSLYLILRNIYALFIIMMMNLLESLRAILLIYIEFWCIINLLLFEFVFIYFLDRSLEQSMFTKANELQEDISIKKFEFRTAQMHLAAVKSQVRIQKDILFNSNFFSDKYY